MLEHLIEPITILSAAHGFIHFMNPYNTAYGAGAVIFTVHMEKLRNSEVQKYALSYILSNVVMGGDGMQTQVVWLQAPTSVPTVLDFPTEFAADVLPAVFSVLFVVGGGGDGGV